jgi:hypothetical protein
MASSTLPVAVKCRKLAFSDNISYNIHDVALAGLNDFPTIPPTTLFGADTEQF